MNPKSMSGPNKVFNIYRPSVEKCLRMDFTLDSVLSRVFPQQWFDNRGFPQKWFDNSWIVVVLYPLESVLSRFSVTEELMMILEV